LLTLSSGANPVGHVQQVGTLLCSSLGDTKDVSESQMKMSICIYLRTYVQNLKNKLNLREIKSKNTEAEV